MLYTISKRNNRKRFWNVNIGQGYMAKTLAY